MPNVTVLGVGNAVLTISVNSSAAASVAQNALNLVSADISASTVTPFAAGSAQPAGRSELVFTNGSPTAVTITGSVGPVVAIVDNATNAISITDAQSVAQTVVSGTGGLTFNQTAASVTGSLIVAGGGANYINLAAGANTVSLDITPSATSGGSAIGSSTVNAFGGGALIEVNANTNNATTFDNALIGAAGRDTVVMSGSGAVFLADTSNVVSVLNGGSGFFGNASSSQGATNIVMGAGNETIGVYSGSVESVTGSSSGTMYFAGGPGLSGRAIINPEGQSVVVFPGTGLMTLFGAGDASGVANSGTDVVLNGTGFFHAGSGGGSLLESAASIGGASATTLEGGGSGDVLIAQSANVSLKGSAGTSLMVASGETISGGVIRFGLITVSGGAGQTFSALGANGGATLNAGAANALMFGAESGANTIVSGTGSSTVFGHSGATSGSGNTYLDGGVGSMAIFDFNGSDFFRLTGAEAVSGVSSNSGGSSTVTLSDGTSITFLNGFINASNVSTYFHS